MAPRYRAALALTLALAASLPTSASTPAHRHRRSSFKPPAAVPAASDLYSRRALRRARIILELKLLELRRERLDGVRKALEKHLPVDELLKTP